MVTRQQIEDYAAAIGRKFRPQRIILFGSYAYGKPTPDSDVDLLVVMRHRGRGMNKAIEIETKVPAPFPCDLLVRSPRKLQERLVLGDFFLREIVAKGQVLYETADR
jgi:predicted nucleotidyltransferase